MQGIGVLKVIVALSCLAAAGGLVFGGLTSAYFTDTTVIEDNVIATGFWGYSGCLKVETGCARLTECGCLKGRILHHVLIENTCTQPLKITSIVVSWNPDLGERVKAVVILPVFATKKKGTLCSCPTPDYFSTESAAESMFAESVVPLAAGTMAMTEEAMGGVEGQSTLVSLIDSIVFWHGNAASGTSLEGSFTLQTPSAWIRGRNVVVWFDDDMAGKTITLRFVLDDGSEKEVSLQV